MPASEAPAPADKPAKSKADLKAERRARQEAERASKGKKGDVGQPAPTGKLKAPPSELQPGTVVAGGDNHNNGAYAAEKVTLCCCFYLFPVVKRLPEHVQVDNPEVVKKLAKKLERQQVSCFMCRL